MLKKGLKFNSKKTEVLVSSKEKTRASIRDNKTNTVLKQVGEILEPWYCAKRRGRLGDSSIYTVLSYLLF